MGLFGARTGDLKMKATKTSRAQQFKNKSTENCGCSTPNQNTDRNALIRDPLSSNSSSVLPFRKVAETVAHKQADTIVINPYPPPYSDEKTLEEKDSSVELATNHLKDLSSKRLMKQLNSKNLAMIIGNVVKQYKKKGFLTPNQMKMINNIWYDIFGGFLQKHSPKLCLACRAPFEVTRPDRLYCSPKCRQRQLRKRKFERDKDRVIDAVSVFQTESKILGCSWVDPKFLRRLVKEGWLEIFGPDKKYCVGEKVELDKGKGW